MLLWMDNYYTMWLYIKLQKQMIIADLGVEIVKLSPEKFFGEIHEEGKPPKYQWSGILLLLVKNEIFKNGE